MTQSGHQSFCRFALHSSRPMMCYGCSPRPEATPMRRRNFIAGLASTTATWPLSARAQQPSIPVIAFLSGRSADTSVRVATAFRKGLNETGYVEGQNVTVEDLWLEGQYDRLPTLLADLIRRQVAVIAVPAVPLPRSRLKLQRRRSRSSSASAKTRSGLVSLPASADQAAMRPA